jgi:regulator of replication initiation timing
VCQESLGDALSESFFVVPGSDASPAALKRENAALKLENQSLKKRLEAAEKVMQVRKEQDLHLRDSIFQATREVCNNTLLNSNSTFLISCEGATRHEHFHACSTARGSRLKQSEHQHASDPDTIATGRSRSAIHT